jgi:hypothetical protein
LVSAHGAQVYQFQEYSARTDLMTNLNESGVVCRDVGSDPTQDSFIASSSVYKISKRRNK